YYFLEETPKEIKEPLRILNYYMLFFSVKIHRAIFSGIEEKEIKYEDSTFDSKNSAFLSYVSIVKITNALKNISVYKNLDRSLYKKIIKYLSLLKNLNLVLKERFCLEIIS
ncbi:MAG: hypothetical protein ACD_12C00250G0001, partial [uncultured bacterium]